MAKKRSELSAREWLAGKSARPIRDRNIDFSDIPESTDEELKRARRVGRPKSGKPVRQLIAIRIDPSLLQKLRKMAAREDMPYQSFIHLLLEKASQKAA